MGGLIDEVREHPAEIDGPVQAKQQMGRSSTALVAETWRPEAGRGANDVLGSLRLTPVSVDDCRAGHGVAESELPFSRWERRSQVTAFNPAPLHVRQVVDDADDR